MECKKILMWKLGNRTLRGYLCWLFGHNFICAFRQHWGMERGRLGSETTFWMCQHCDEQREEQWDT